MTDVLMPALSPTMEEGTLAKWHVKVGDAVRSGDVIAEIETDKATMEVEAVDEGVVEELLVPVIDMDPVLPVGAYGQAVNSGSVQALAHMQESIPALLPHDSPYPSANAEPQLPPSVTSESISQRMARLAEAVAREPRIGTSAVAHEDMRTGLEAFCRGAFACLRTTRRSCTT